MDEKMKENEEEFFLLQSLKELTPLIRLIIKELAGMIRNDERRQLFLYTVLQGNIKDFSVRKRMKYRQAQKAFEGLVQEIKSQAGFLRTYKEENIRLSEKARLPKGLFVAKIPGSAKTKHSRRYKSGKGFARYSYHRIEIRYSVAADHF